MTIELVKDGWVKLEEKIQEIENLAWDGVFSDTDRTPKFQRIAEKAKNLRRILTEVSVINPTAESDGPTAA